MPMNSLASKQGPRYRHTSGEEEPYETIAVEKLTPIIGAEISGVDIGRLMSDDSRSNPQMDEIHRALADNLVIFFRDQHITPEQHLACGRKFGELHIHPAAPHEGDDPAQMKIHADKDSPRANGEGWHSDLSCDLEPPMGSILHIRQCPPHGGDTLFASMYAAYEALSDRMKAYLDGLTALHDGTSVYRGLYANFGVADKAAYPQAEHPVLRTQPVTISSSLFRHDGTHGCARKRAQPCARESTVCSFCPNCVGQRCNKREPPPKAEPGFLGVAKARLDAWRRLSMVNVGVGR